MPRTINDIIPPSRRRQMGEMPPVMGENPAPMQPPPPLPPRAPMYPPRRRFPWGTAIIALIIIAVCIGALYAFSGAKVEIAPTTNAGAVSGNFTATPSTGTLPFALVNVEKTASENVPAESTVTANDAAQGTVTVYNEQSTPQQLITNTRFETSSGLVFRIHSPITVPAATGSTPGSLNVIVYADAAGDSYNIGPASFTLPGLSGTPQFSKVYAKSTASTTGGFSGTRPAVSQATDDAEHAKLKATLQGQIADEVAPKVPDGYVLIPGSVFTAYSTLPDSTGPNGQVSVQEQATATAVVFPESALATALAPQIIGASYTGQPITLENVSGLALTAASSTASSTAPSASAPFSFSLSGNATLVWTVNPTQVAGAVAGKSRASAQSVLTGFPEISKATLTLRPFWRGTFPADPSQIDVVIDDPGTSK